MIILKKATPEALPFVQRFLAQQNLPISDLPADLAGFTLAFDDDELVGTAGLEVLGEVGLLRSVAVAETQRGRQLGRQLFGAALDYARQQQISDVFLITDSAAAYFEKNGFQRVERPEVPAGIAATAQFSSLCPASSVVLRVTLNVS